MSMEQCWAQVQSYFRTYRQVGHAAFVEMARLLWTWLYAYGFDLILATIGERYVGRVD